VFDHCCSFFDVDEGRELTDARQEVFFKLQIADRSQADCIQGLSAYVKKRAYVTANRPSGSRVLSIQSYCGDGFRDIFI